jgi:ABC-2 type transport system permease protein
MFNIIIKEIKELYSDKKIWIGILTVLIMIIIGTSYNSQNQEKPTLEQLRLGVINNDDSTYSDLLLNYFNSSETFSSLITVVMGEEAEVKEAFHLGELDIYLEIPKNFAYNLMKLKHTPINVTVNISDTTKAILFKNVLTSYAKYISAVEANAVGLYEIMKQDGMEKELVVETNQTVSIDLILTALGKEVFFDFQPVEQFPTTTILNYYISSVLVMALLYSGLYIGFQVLQEMKQGTFTRLRTTKTPLYQFLIAKTIIILLILCIAASVALSIMNGKLVSEREVLFCLSIIMFSLCEALFLSAVFGTTQRFVLAGNLLIFYFTVLGGGIIPIQFLPQDMLVLSKVTPNYYMIQGLLGIGQGQYDKVNQFAMGFLLLALFLFGSALFLYQKRSVIIDEV